MKSMELREQAGAQVRGSQSESLHTPHDACGLWPAGRQLAWLKGGLQWRFDVDFGTEVSMLCGVCRTRPAPLHS